MTRAARVPTAAPNVVPVVGLRVGRRTAAEPGGEPTVSPTRGTTPDLIRMCIPRASSVLEVAGPRMDSYLCPPTRSGHAEISWSWGWSGSAVGRKHSGQSPPAADPLQLTAASGAPEPSDRCFPEVAPACAPDRPRVSAQGSGSGCQATWGMRASVSAHRGRPLGR